MENREKTQPERLCCQSCAMPLQKTEDFGTHAAGRHHQDYCHYCFQNGQFTEYDITIDQMIEKCTGIMGQMKMPGARIEQTRSFIPRLKRWEKYYEQN